MILKEAVPRDPAPAQRKRDVRAVCDGCAASAAEGVTCARVNAGFDRGCDDAVVEVFDCARDGSGHPCGLVGVADDYVEGGWGDGGDIGRGVLGGAIVGAFAGCCGLDGVCC